MGRIEDAFSAAPRKRFLPRGARWRAGFDGPIQIGEGQTNSQPATVEAMLRLLDVRAGDRVLDVGSGSGWTTALLGHLVGPDGWVLGLELEPRLVRFGSDNLAGLELSWVRIEEAAPGTLGRPEEAPFDRILVSAMARWLPEELVGQLGDDGRLVVPVNGEMLLVRRTPGGTETTSHGQYRFVPLR